MMLFVVLVYSCCHAQIDPLVKKLEENKCIEVQQLGDNTGASRLSDDVDMLHLELNKGSILIDCSCPRENHSNMHKAVKSCTILPSGDPDSDKWKIIQLNNTENDTSSWSKSSIDYVDVMNYNNLNKNVVDKVDDKVMEYLGSRTSSISEQNGIQDSTKDQDRLLPEILTKQNEIIRKQEEIEVQISSVHRAKEEDVTARRVQHEETQELLKEHKKNVELIITKQELFGKYNSSNAYLVNVIILIERDLKDVVIVKSEQP